MFICSICNCNNIMVLADFDTDPKIDIVQNYIRTTLPKIVKSIEERSGQQLSDIGKTYLFSERHVSDPENFTFVHGERVVIKKISEHVKREKSTQQNRFNVATAEKRFEQTSLIETAVGLIFSDQQLCLTLPTNSDKKHLDEAVIDSKKRLLISIEKVNSEYKLLYGLNDVSELSEDNIRIEVNGKGNIRSIVQCVFCKKNVKLSSKQHQSSCTWVLSNLKRHIKSSCEIIRKACSESANKLSDNDMNPGTDDTENNGNKSVFVALEIQPVIQNIDEPNDKLNAEFTSYVDSLKTQVKPQRIKMISSVLSNGEREKTCEIQLDSKVSNIEVVEIARDGNCLFSAVSHQLDDFKIGSTDHTLASSKLRVDTIAHIKANLPLYERDIKGRIYEQSMESKIYDFSKRYKEFLDEFLAKDGFWAGSESLKAIAVMMEINIIVFNEKGDVYFGNQYDPNYKRSIYLNASK